MAGLEGTKTDRQALTGDISVKPGIDGKSVTIVKITESTEDGGNNIVEFSDGSRLKIKNGSGGKIGIDGKSAYQYAQDGGYTGTEEEFALLMSQENLQTEKVDKISIEVSKLSEDIATKASAIKEKASGEVIVVTDSDEAKPLGLAIDGKSEQNQYSGKNLVESFVENNGLNAYQVSLHVKANLKPSTQYTISFKGTTGNNIYPNENIFTSEAWYTITSGTNELKLTTKDTLDMSDGAQYVADKGWSIFKNAGSNNTVAHNFSEVMISIEGGEYEPYCGGIPSPNPSYPQEIRNIGVYDEASGKYAVEVKCNTRNELDCRGLVETSYSGITFTPVYDEKGALKYINANGTATERAFCTLKQYAENVFASKVLNGCKGGSKTTYMMTFINYDESNNYIQEIADIGNGCVIAESPKYRVQIRVESGVTLNNVKFYPMISAEGGDYEPYKETTATVYLDEPLRKGDKAYWNGGSKVRIDRYRAVEVFDGSKEYGYDNDGVWHITAISQLGYNIKEKGLCDRFIVQNEGYADVKNEGHKNFNTMYIGGNVISIRTSLFSTPNGEGFKKYFAENPTRIELNLATPITEEIDIDLGELTMFYPTTVISNDCNANMEVTYIADTKAYIDKKFAELATAMV